MKSHLLKHTESPKRCPIPDCDSILKNANVLRMHIKKIHYNIKMSAKAKSDLKDATGKPKKSLGNFSKPNLGQSVTTYKINEKYH